MRLPFRPLKGKKHFSPRWVPLLVLTISLVATLFATYHLAITTRAKDEVRFENEIQQTTDAIRERIQIYAGALQGGTALFAVHEKLSREEFRTYADRLNLHASYPGIQGFGFAKYVEHEDKADFIEKMREQISPNFDIRPTDDREAYTPIIYLEPEDVRNQEAIGFDMFSEAVRRHGISTARDTGRRAISGMVTLVQEIGPEKQPGFLIYSPAFRGGTIPPTVEERREKILGFVYAPFRANDFFTGIFSSPTHPQIYFEVYDGEEEIPEKLLHASVGPPSSPPQLSTVSTFKIPGHQWTLLFQSTPAFESGSSYFLAPWILTGGVFLSFILFGITLALTRARSNAEVSHQAAAAQRKEYQVTLASIGDAVIATDLNGKITFMNPVAENLTQWLLSDSRGKPLSEVFRIIHSLTGAALPPPTQRVLTENRHTTLPDHTVLIGKNGKKLPIEDSAAPIRDMDGNLRGVVLVFHDVSAKHATELLRRQAEKDLRDAQSRLESGIFAASVGTWIWDLKEDRIFADAYISKIFSATPEQEEGAPINEYLKAVHPEDLPQLRKRIEGVLDHGDTREAEFRIPGKNGMTRWFNARGKIERDDSGTPFRFVGAMFDVTRRKQTEEALAKAKAELERYAKTLEETVAERTARLRDSIAELEAFSYSLSHDLRAPLRAIRGFTQITLEEFGEGFAPEAKSYLQKVISAASRMDRLIQDVLAFSRISRQEITVEEIDVEKLLLGIIQEQPEFQPPQTKITIESGLAPILGHHASLTQCLTNLLDNAVKFVAPGVQPKIRIWSESRNGQVRLWVEDNGIGMKNDMQGKLFEMFQRIHSGHYPGVGIGLAIVRKAVERMGGQAGVESEFGQGSRFWVQLPGAET